MVTALFAGCFTLSALTGLWALWVLIDWLAHGCPPALSRQGGE